MHSACFSEVSLSTWLKKKRIRHFLPLNLTSSLFFLGEKQGEDGDVAQAWASNHWPLRCRGGAFTSRTHADKTPFMMLKQHQTHQMAARLLQSGPRRRLAPEEATLKSAIVRVLAMIDEAASERAQGRGRWRGMLQIDDVYFITYVRLLRQMSFSVIGYLKSVTENKPI